MKSIRYTTANGRISLEIDASSPKAAFEAIAEAQEVFEEPCCGSCRSKSIQ